MAKTNIYHIQAGNEFRQVKGRRIVIKGYEEFHFFVHGSRGDYSISEATTGHAVKHHGVVKTVVSATKEMLDVFGKERVVNTIISARKKFAQKDPVMAALLMAKYGGGK